MRCNCWNVLRLTTSPSLRTHSHPTILQPPRSVDRTAAFWRGIQIAPKGLVTWNVVMQRSNPMRAGLLSHIGRQVVLCQGPENFITFLKLRHNNLLWPVFLQFLYLSLPHLHLKTRKSQTLWVSDLDRLTTCLVVGLGVVHAWSFSSWAFPFEEMNVKILHLKFKRFQTHQVSFKYPFYHQYIIHM